MPTFSDLVRKYIERTGITDAELARSIGVRRQTIFRWKEGLVARPRHRDDVLRLGKRLRLTPSELDELLLTAGFPPQTPSAPANAMLTDESAAQLEESQDSPAAEQDDDTALDSPAEANHDRRESGRENEASVVDESAAAEGAKRRTLRPSRGWTLAAAVPVLLIIGLFIINGGWPGAEVTPTPTTTQARQNATATAASTPSLVELPTVPADETWLLIARFANFVPNQGFNVAGRIEAALDRQIRAANLAATKAELLPVEITDEAHALRVLEETGAALLIWGEFDSGRIQVSLTTEDARNPSEWEHLLSSADALITAINADVPEEVNTLALYILGRLYKSEGRNAEARVAFEEALAQNPQEDIQPYLHFYLGGLFDTNSSEELSAAIEQSTDAIALLSGGEEVAIGYYNRATAYWHLYRVRGDEGDLERSIDDFTQSLALLPNYRPAYTTRGAAFYSRNGVDDLERAIADYSTAIELDAGAHRTWYNRGLARLRLDEAEWAEDMKRAAELSPNDVLPYTGLCWGYALSPTPETALEYCEKALGLRPDKGDIYDSRGIVYARLGQTEEALGEFEAYLAWLREQPPAYYERFNGPLIKEFIEALEKGEQPITDEVLAELR